MPPHWKFTCPQVHFDGHMTFPRIEILAQFSRFLQIIFMLIGIMDEHWRKGREASGVRYYYGLWHVCRFDPSIEGVQCVAAKALSTYPDCDIVKAQQSVTALAVLGMCAQFLAVLFAVIGTVVFNGNSRVNAVIKVILGLISIGFHFGASIASTTLMTCPEGPEADYAAGIFYTGILPGALALFFTCYRGLHIVFWKGHHHDTSSEPIPKSQATLRHRAPDSHA